MLNVRFLLPPLFAAAVVVLAGALYWPSTPQASSAPPAAPPLPTKPQSAALAVLDQALAALDPARVQWLETDVWQQVQIDDLTCQAEGRYLAGPEQRFRLDLRTQVGGTAGRMLVVSDGRVIRQASRVGEGAWGLLAPIDLRPANGGKREKEPPPLDGFLQAQLAGGLPSLLKNLRSQLVWVRKETVRRQDRRFIRLTALVPDEATSKAASPAGQPRRARLYLDPQTLWPHRLEWWGKARSSSDDELLMQMELREPVLNRALTAEQCARVFALDR